MTERVETTLRWVGDWPWWIGVPAAAILAIAAFVFYRRDVTSLAWWMRGGLPVLRALSVGMIVVMLSGPVLHHRKTIGQLAKLWVLVDNSQSMTLTDAGMDSGRKILILQRLGLLSGEAMKLDLPNAGELLAEAQSAAERAASITAMEAAVWKQITDQFVSKSEEARTLLSGVIETERLERMKKELVDPGRELGSRSLQEAEDRNRALKDIAQLGERTRRWQEELRDLFDKSIAAQLTDENSPVRAALLKFDSLPRWQRVQSLLLEGKEEKKLLGQLGSNYEVQVLAIEANGTNSIWQPTAQQSSLPQAMPKPAAEVTNLAEGLKVAVSSQQKDQRGAVVLFSDGQHNSGESPVEVAGVLGAQGTPVFPVSVGSYLRPRDIAVLRAGGPESVFHEDHYRGEIVLKDDVPAGQPFTVSIRDGDKIVWEEKLISENRPLRRVPFDFAVKELAAARNQVAGTPGQAETTGFPVELRVSVTGVDGERELTNNEGSLRFRAITQKRRILIVDGRPRWETRYLRNMFERDEQWEVNCVIVNTRPGQSGLARGDKPEHFPAEPAQLDTYDLVFFGEVPRSVWKGDELKWLRDFVEQRGGALVFIDGARGYFSDYEDTPLGPVFPVDFKAAAPVREGIQRVGLTERSAQLAAFALSPERESNTETWSRLPPPHWLSGAPPLPGAEVLIDAEINGQRQPAAVVRSFGAGKVYYQGFDDSWRWRHEVADQWHVKFWNQLANFAAEPPFAVRDKFVSLDAGAITYEPGANADLRIRLRDGEGKPVSNATVDAVLYKDGQKAATIRMTAENGGLFRGRTAALEPGAYEVAVETAAIPANELKARTTFKVERRDSGEMSQLSANEDLLRQVAANSGGRFVREENFNRILESIAPMSQGRVVESDTVLWQSWWWFAAVIGMLTLEWVLRKRAGML